MTMKDYYTCDKCKHKRDSDECLECLQENYYTQDENGCGREDEDE